MWLQQIILMIAQEQDEILAEVISKLFYPLQDAIGIRSAVKQIPQKDQSFSPDFRFDPVSQRIQRSTAAMDIPDNDCSHRSSVVLNYTVPAQGFNQCVQIGSSNRPLYFEFIQDCLKQVFL